MRHRVGVPPAGSSATTGAARWSRAPPCSACPMESLRFHLSQRALMAPHHVAGGLRPRSAMPKRRRSAVSGVWSLRDPPVTRAGLLTADWPRGRGAAAYLTPNLSALLALYDGGLVRS